MLAEMLRRSAWLAGGSAFGRILPLLVLLAASRHFDAEGFATVSVAFAWTGVAMSLSSAGLATVMARQMGALSDDGDRRALLNHCLRRSFVSSGLVALIAVTAGPAGVSALFGKALDGSVVWPAVLSGALWSQVAMAVAALNGCHRPREAGATLALSGLMQGTPMALVLLNDGSPIAMAWAMVLGSTGGMAFGAGQLVHVFGKGLLQQQVIEGQQKIRMTSVLWQSMAVAVVMPVSFFASSLLTRSADGQRQLALYFLLEQSYLVITYGPALLGQALMPMISLRTRGKQSSQTSDELIIRVVKASLMLAAAGLLIAALLSVRIDLFLPWLQHAVLEPQDAWAGRWMLAGAALVACTSLLGGTMQGQGEFARASLLNVAWCLLFLGGAWALLTWGAAGLQCARFLATLALISVTATLLLRQMRRKPAGQAQGR